MNITGGQWISIILFALAFIAFELFIYLERRRRRGAKPEESPFDYSQTRFVPVTVGMSDELACDIGTTNLVIAMRAKLAQKRSEGRYGWHDPDECSIGQLRALLRDHATKGDPVDVANLAMMIYNRVQNEIRDINNE